MIRGKGLMMRMLKEDAKIQTTELWKMTAELVPDSGNIYRGQKKTWVDT